MLVVSDTSPIRALSVLGLLSVLHTLYGEVLVPPAVVRELEVEVRGLPAVAVGRLAFVRIQMPRNTEQVAQLRERLDAGEAEAVALALEIGADAVLMDESKGRRVAASLGLHPIGVIGVLLEAKKRRAVGQIGPLLDALDRTITFRVSAELRKYALSLAGE